MSKKKYKKSDDLLDDAAKSLKKFRKVTRQIGKLSTGQKIVGGLALLAAGLTYLAQQQAEDEPSKDDKPKPLALPAAADESPASSETEEAAASAASAGPARRKKNGKSH